MQKVEKKEKPDVMPSGEGTNSHRKNKIPRKHESAALPLHIADLNGA